MHLLLYNEIHTLNEPSLIGVACYLVLIKYDISLMTDMLIKLISLDF